MSAGTSPVGIEIDCDYALSIDMDLTDDEIRLLAKIEDRFSAAHAEVDVALSGGEPSKFWPFLIEVRDRAAAIRVGRTDVAS